MGIVVYPKGVVIATDAASLHFWDINLTINFRNLDLTTFSFKLFNFNVSTVIATRAKVLVATTEGDLLEIYTDNL